MKKLLIHGGNKLKGEVTIGGAKNATVALIPASILADTIVEFSNVPDISDVNNLQKILSSMNVTSKFDKGDLKIDPTKIIEAELPSTTIKSLRASYYFMGSLLGKFGRATITFPGGDDIGPRPINQHIKGFKALGATVIEKDDTIYINAPNGLKGARIFLDLVSVGATINIILAAVKAKGTTILENAAKEPEIIDLVIFLNSIGANIIGAGTDVIKINGVDKLESKNVHKIIPDRIEAGTYLSLAAAQGDGITIKNIIPEHLESFTAKLIEAGIALEINNDSIYVPKTDKLNAISIKTAPFPGFATDLQQPITPLLTKAEGISTIEETIYPERIRHIPELNKLGMNIKVNDKNIIEINQTTNTTGNTVKAVEIRSGASLVIGALMSNNETIIEDSEHILRGYDQLIHKLTKINADIKMID